MREESKKTQPPIKVVQKILMRNFSTKHHINCDFMGGVDYFFSTRGVCGRKERTSILSFLLSRSKQFLVSSSPNSITLA